MTPFSPVQFNPGPRPWQIVLVPLAVALAFFLAIAPTLPKIEFSNGSENLNAETVLEIRRGGPWLLPTLNGGQRISKPPWTAWFTATFVSPETVAALTNADPAARDVAYRRFVWEVRWPALLVSCLTLALTCEMGRLLTGSLRAGVAAALVAGSTMMFLRFGRVATLDVQLGFWVTLANVFLLHALLRGRWWTGCCGAGLAIGVAFMAKGPVALVQTVAPFVGIAIAHVLQRRYRATRNDTAEPAVELTRARPGPIIGGVVLFLAVATPWFLLVLYRTPGIMEKWVREVTRVGATNLDPDSWYNYINGSLSMLPWYLFFVIGLIMTAQHAWRGDRRALALVMLAVLPVFVMSFFKDKPMRYLQPMLAPAAVMTAVALTGQFKAWRERSKIDQRLAAIHVVAMLFVVVAVPVAGRHVLKTVEGGPWFSTPLALTVVAVGLVAWAVYVVVARRPGLGLAAGTAVIMIALQPVIVKGYADSPGGRSEMKPIADFIWSTGVQDVVIYQGNRKRTPPMDIFIYSNRLFPLLKTLPSGTEPGAPAIALLLRTGENLSPRVPPPWQVVRQWDVKDDRRWYALSTTPERFRVTAPMTAPVTP